MLYFLHYGTPLCSESCTIVLDSPSVKQFHTTLLKVICIYLSEFPNEVPLKVLTEAYNRQDLIRNCLRHLISRFSHYNRIARQKIYFKNIIKIAKERFDQHDCEKLIQLKTGDKVYIKQATRYK